MSVLKCTECGKENSNNSLFCNYCGSKLNNNSSDFGNQKNSQQFFSEFQNGEMDREFLLTNIKDIMTLHYISRNFDENIVALQSKAKDINKEQPGEPPLPPVSPNSSDKAENTGDYEEYEEPALHSPVGFIIFIDLCILFFGMFLFPIALGGAFLFTVSSIHDNKKVPERNKAIDERNKATYERNLDEYHKRLEEYNRKVKEIDEANNVAKPNLAKAIDSLNLEQKEALSLLDECYEINIIPSKYRNIYAITFIYDYLSTSKGSLRDALFACDLDKIQSQLEKIIKNQSSMICKLSRIEAINEKQLEQQRIMIDRLENIERNTYDIAEAAEQCAQYNKIIAHNTKVSAYCSAMTYIDTLDINDFDPYSPATIKDFALEKFSGYYQE